VQQARHNRQRPVHRTAVTDKDRMCTLPDPCGGFSADGQLLQSLKQRCGVPDLNGAAPGQQPVGCGKKIAHIGTE
jgi:hypothetical protein